MTHTPPGVEAGTIRLGADLAYYALFAIVPLLAISLALAQFLFSQEELQKQLAGRLENILGGEADQVAALLTEQLGNASTQSGLGVIGVVSLLVTGVALFVALQDALNTIWEAPVASGMGSVPDRTTMRRLASATRMAAMLGQAAERPSRV